MITRTDHLSSFLAGTGLLQTAGALFLVVTRTLALPLLALGRVRMGTRFMGPCSAAVAAALLVVMEFTFAVLFVVVGALLNPAALIFGGLPGLMASPRLFTAFSWGVFFVMLAQLALARLRERRGDRIHTRSSGYPWLGYLGCGYLLGPLGARLVGEPVAWFAIAYAVGRVDMVLPLYLKLAACSLVIVNFLEYADLLEEERDHRDAEIENEFFERVASGRIAAGTIHEGVALPDIGRAAYAEKVRGRRAAEPGYAPGEEPAMEGVWADVAEDEVAAARERDAALGRAYFLEQLRGDIDAEADGDVTAGRS